MKYLEDNPKVNAKLDLTGMLLQGSALSFLCYGAVDFASAGLSSFNILLMFAGTVAVVAFLYWEAIIVFPAVDLHTFKNKVHTASIFASFFQSLGFLSVTFLIIMYIQSIKGLDPFTASLKLTPGYIISSFLLPYMGRLSDRFGAREIPTVGIVLMCFAILMYMTLTISSNYYTIILASIITGIGGAMFWPANSSAVISNAQHQH
ncbi:MAG: MFS transporter [Candidatus Methanoperedens sp.]|nr:MFS transporter [Candidatus Methanoperedens sp.]